jgi:hypothetical protein
MTLPWYRYFHDQNQAASGFVTIPAGTILGNSGASSSYPGPLTIGTGLLLSNGVLSSTITGGSVTSVGLAVSSPFTVTNTPITTSGTISLNVSPQPANEVWAGPTSGASAIPTFRPLVAADIPPLPYVTSVGLSAPSIFSVSGSPVTSSGTLTFSLNTQASNLVWAGPSSGSAATPSFRSLVAADIPSLPYISSTSTQNANTFLSGPSSGAAASPTFRTMVLADLPSIAASTLLGNPSASSSTPTTITIGSGLSLSTGGVLSSIAFSNQNANLIFAGPSSGSAAAPAFRSMVLADLPSIASQTLLGNPASTSGTPTTITIGANLNLSTSGVLSATGSGGGGVTSVGLSAPADYTVTGSPVTGSGTLTFAYATQSANVVHAGPTSGSAATPTWRTLVLADIPSSVWSNSNLPHPVDCTTSNFIHLDWNNHAASQVGLTVDSTYQGYLWHSGNFNPNNYLLLTGGTLTNSLTINMGSLGTSAGSLAIPLTFTSTTSNTDQIVFQHNRSTAGTGWDTCNYQIYRKVDTTQQGFVQFGEQTSGYGLAFGSGSNIYGSMYGTGTTAGLWNLYCLQVTNHLSSYGSQGSYITWNQTSGGGEMDFICNQGGGTGGFKWYNTSGAGTTLNNVATLDNSGNLTVSGSISGQAISGTTGTFSGNINANSGTISSTQNSIIIQSNANNTGSPVTICEFIGIRYAGSGVAVQTTTFIPISDNLVSNGINSARWTAVYAVNGTIQTSDEHEKTPLVSLSDAELSASNRILDTIGVYRWLKDVEEKGEKAKHHIGVIAQKVCAIFDEEGLNWVKYGMITFEDDRYGINYAQLSVFLSAGLHSRLKRIEADMGL